MTDPQEFPSDPQDGAMEPISDESKAQLEAFTAGATLKYSIKDYDAAAELYSQATELQARINGEMSPRNADLLYAYGRCLYHLALRNSDVLGPKVAGEAREEASKGPSSKKQSKPADSIDGPPGEVVSNGAEEKNGAGSLKEELDNGKTPLFQFTGDENFDDSEDDEEGANGKEGGEGEDNPEDDFANAYEVLDLARILLLKRIEDLGVDEAVSEGKGKGKAPTDSEEMQQLKERLADTHDLQAEISLEGERFPNAVTDLRAALELKNELFLESSSLIAEAHYKLSLALEFSSVTRQKDADGNEDGADARVEVDELMREEAANEMEAAIRSCKLRIKVEEDRISGTATDYGKKPTTKKSMKIEIDDVKEMVEEMEQRLLELRQPAISINDQSSTGEGGANSSLGGILESMLGEPPAAQEAKLQHATNNATDVTNLIKRSKKSTSAAATAATTTDGYENVNDGKRKVEFDDEIVEVGTGKKARLSDGDD